MSKHNDVSKVKL